MPRDAVLLDVPRSDGVQKHGAKEGEEGQNDVNSIVKRLIGNDIFIRS